MSSLRRRRTADAKERLAGGRLLMARRPRAASVVHRSVESDETLRNHLRARLAQLEELIAAAIAEDLGAPENDLRRQ